MRPIKFRGKYMGEWIYGHYVVIEDGASKSSDCIWSINLNKGIPVDSGSVSQYTGLKDKKGKEIYEGDIGWDDHSECYGIVTFDDGAFNYEWENICELLSETHIEIVGNVYDNPELLEENNESR